MTIDAAQLLSFMRARRSIRQYQSRSVPTDLLDQIMEAATWAPSAHNRQPWRFVIISELETKRSLARAMGARLRSHLEADGLDAAIIKADVDRSYQRMTSAPLLIVLCLTLADMDKYPDAERRAHERTMAVQSTAMAGQNMLLMAQGLGLGACWMCAPLFCPDLVRDVLDLPADWLAQGMITLGFPAVSRCREREPWEAKSLWR